jgi:hypothetical protein
MTDAYIVESVNSYRYNMDDVQEFNDSQTQPLFEFPLPESTSTENLLYRFEGQRTEIRITFAIVNNGTDRAAGTYTGSIITVDEQTDYLKNHIFTEGSSTYWTLTDSDDYSGGVNGALTEFAIKKFPARPGYREGVITFVVGDVSS